VPVEPYDEEYLKNRSPPIKHMSFQAYIRKLQNLTSGDRYRLLLTYYLVLFFFVEVLLLVWKISVVLLRINVQQVMLHGRKVGKIILKKGSF
jgi:hypothetical protein